MILVTVKVKKNHFLALKNIFEYHWHRTKILHAVSYTMLLYRVHFAFCFVFLMGVHLNFNTGMVKLSKSLHCSLHIGREGGIVLFNY